eukprot:scaffold29_cov251-Pinguiococcus_pyrenoidosus.AAC.4
MKIQRQVVGRAERHGRLQPAEDIGSMVGISWNAGACTFQLVLGLRRSSQLLRKQGNERASRGSPGIRFVRPAPLLPSAGQPTRKKLSRGRATYPNSAEGSAHALSYLPNPPRSSAKVRLFRRQLLCTLSVANARTEGMAVWAHHSWIILSRAPTSASTAPKRLFSPRSASQDQTPKDYKWLKFHKITMDQSYTSNI